MKVERYSEEEKQIVRDIWASTKLLKQQMHLLPGRTAWSIQRKQELPRCYTTGSAS